MLFITTNYYYYCCRRRTVKNDTPPKTSDLKDGLQVGIHASETSLETMAVSPASLGDSQSQGTRTGSSRAVIITLAKVDQRLDMSIAMPVRTGATSFKDGRTCCKIKAFPGVEG